MLKGFKTRIYPTKEQEKILFIYCEYSHKLRNFLVEKFNDNLPDVGQFGVIGYKERDLERDFNAEREKFKIPLPQKLIRGALMNYACSVKRVYSKIANKPKFHKYDPNKQSFYMPGLSYKISNGTVPLPNSRDYCVKGMSKIKVEESYINKLNIVEIKEPRYTYSNGKWYISGSYEDNITVNKKQTTFIGFDWGIKNFMTTSQGEFLNYPQKGLREYERIRKLQSIKDKKIKDSNNYKKIYNKYKRAWERFGNLKSNFIEQTTTELCKNYNIAIEDLVEAKILKNSRSKRRIRIIAPRYLFIEKLKWKCLKFGTQFVEVNPAYTSRICSRCGKIKDNLSLKDRIFKCDCGFELDRDVNAAINIAARAVCNSLQDHSMVN